MSTRKLQGLPRKILGLSNHPIITRTVSDTGQSKAVVMIVAMVAIESGSDLDLIWLSKGLGIDHKHISAVLRSLEGHCREYEGLA